MIRFDCGEMDVLILTVMIVRLDITQIFNRFDWISIIFRWLELLSTDILTAENGFGSHGKSYSSCNPNAPIRC